MNLETLATSFGRDLRAQRRSKSTVESYLRTIRAFVAWLAAEGLSEGLESLTRRNLKDHFSHLVEAGLAPATIQVRHSAIRSFCTWLMDEEEITSNPMIGVPYPRTKIKPVPVVPDRDLAALVKACAGKTIKDRRDEAIIRFLFDTGVRVSELCGIRFEDLDLDAGSAIVTGKGNKTRRVWLSPKTVRAVDRYLRMRTDHRYAYSPFVFLGERGRFTRNGVFKMVEDRCKQAKVNHIHPHMMRHTFADSFLKAGGQEGELLRLCGWTSTMMLQRYGVSQADERASMAAKRLAVGDRV